MNKQDYARLGQEDAHAGNQSRRPKTPGTWQFNAYMDGWEAAQDERAAPKAKVVSGLLEAFRIAAGGGTKHQRRLAKRSAAFKRKMDRKARLAAADRDLRRKAGKYQKYSSRDWVSDNIKRAPRGRQAFDD